MIKTLIINCNLKYPFFFTYKIYGYRQYVLNLQRWKVFKGNSDELWS